MGKRGPKPSGQKANVSILPPTEAKRPGPPPGMTPRARSRWTITVKGYPVDHFKAGDLPLLREYCEAYDRAVRAEEALQANKDKDGNQSDYVIGSAGGLKAHPACAVKIAAASIMSTLATKLRMCANSRIDKRQAGNAKEDAPAASGRKMFGAS